MRGTTMKQLLAYTVLGILAAGLVAQSVDVDRYLWETCISSNVAAPPEDIDALREEVDRILTAGHLAPLRIQQADQKVEGYALYQEPGRIIATLAMAYPYLTPAQQTQVRTYVRAECANPAWAPWSVQMHLPPQQGSRREWYTMVGMAPTHFWDQDSGIWVTTGVWQWDWWWALDGQRRPRIATLYGLWQYAFISGDWDVVRDSWDAIKTCYLAYRDQAETYGTMSAHIAMARLAHFMNDTDMLAVSSSAFAASLLAGLNFSVVENKTTSYYDFMYGNSRRGGVYKGFMFLNLAPEMGRFLREHVSAAVLARHASGKNAFPYWWIMRAPAAVSWTGHEGRGQIPEIIGMIAPVERWVVNADPQTWASYRLRYACHGIGDCYAIESIVYTISAYGTDVWVDVRTVAPTPPPVVPPTPQPDAWESLVQRGQAVFAGGEKGYVRIGAADRLTIRFRPTDTGEVTVRIYTVRGAKVWEGRADGIAGQMGSCVWPCTDSNNALVAAGVYVVAVKGPGIDVKRRIAVVK